MKHISLFIFITLFTAHSFFAMDKSPAITIAEDAEIITYTLCAAIDMAATSTTKNQITLWALNWRTPAAEHITTLREKHPIKFMCFNDTGSQLATLMQPNKNEIHVKIWDPKERKLLYQFTPSFQRNEPHNLYYSCNTKHPILCIEHANDKDCNTHMWSLKDGKITYRGSIVAGNYYQMPHYCPNTPQSHRDNSKKAGINKYESHHPTDHSLWPVPRKDNTKIIITLFGSILQKQKDD